jgi:hypothetical protein
MTVTRLDRRPTIGTVPFHDTYIAELERDGHTRDDISWVWEVEAAIERIRHASGDARLIGMW